MSACNFLIDFSVRYGDLVIPSEVEVKAAQLALESKRAMTIKASFVIILFIYTTHTHTHAYSHARCPLFT